MITDLILRPAAPEDSVEVHQSLWSDLPLEDVMVRITNVIEQSQKRRAWGLVAMIADEIVGFGQITRWGTRGEICNLIVRADRRSQGIGSALIYGLIEIARAQNLREVEIGAAESNPLAEALYRRLGFREERRMLIELGSGPEPVIYLVMNLDESTVL